ncbi:hypothetical protein FSP39_016938 [Pinctada imbricata]|uniref:glutathione transferase n=1 Tax=Pinctada imbricata TaxID=66713 RepID=A0AA88YPQ0_PINIB|nr:hypothetical protein FSP39_016938 [Pinctada imbricata]
MMLENSRCFRDSIVDLTYSKDYLLHASFLTFVSESQTRESPNGKQNLENVYNDKIYLQSSRSESPMKMRSGAGEIGKTEEEKTACDLMLENSRCFRDGVVDVVFNQNYENIKDDYFKKIRSELDSYEKFLDDKPWFAGDSITACDFQMYEFLDQLKMMKPGVLDDYPKLQALTERFEDLPRIKAYMASDRFQKRPVNNPYYGWIGDK